MSVPVDRHAAGRFDLGGRVALVTGSSSGIGRAIAAALADAGATIAIHHRAEPDDARQTADLIANDVRHAVFAADFARRDAADRLVAEVVDRFERIDILVVNAAMERRRDWADVTDDDLQACMQVNFATTLRLCQLCLPGMAARGWGRVLTIGSIQQQRPNPRSIPYAALKAAQLNLVRNLAREVAGSGVTVNNLAPGAIETPRSAEALANADFRALVERKIPARRIGTPEDCAGPALMLCSDAGGYVTGADLYVDGGWNVADG